MWYSKYTVYNGVEYQVIRYKKGKAKLIDCNRTGGLREVVGENVSFCFIDSDKLSDIYYKRTYGLVDGYSVKILSDEDEFNYYIQTESLCAARALSLKEEENGIYKGYVEKRRVLTKQVKVKVRS